MDLSDFKKTFQSEKKIIKLVVLKLLSFSAFWSYFCINIEFKFSVFEFSVFELYFKREFKLLIFGINFFTVNMLILGFTFCAIFWVMLFTKRIQPFNIHGSLEFIFSTVFSDESFKESNDENLSHFKDELGFDYRLFKDINVIQHFIILEALEKPLFKFKTVKSVEKELVGGLELPNKFENLVLKILSKIFEFTQNEDFILEMLIKEKTNTPQSKGSSIQRKKKRIEAFKSVVSACEDTKEYLKRVDKIYEDIRVGIDMDELKKSLELEDTTRKTLEEKLLGELKEINFFEQLKDVSVCKGWEEKEIAKFFTIIGEDALDFLIIGGIKSIKDLKELLRKIEEKKEKYIRERLKDSYFKILEEILEKENRELKNLLENEISFINAGMEKFIGVHSDPVSAILNNVVLDEFIDSFGFREKGRQILDFHENSTKVWIARKPESLDSEPSWFDVKCEELEKPNINFIGTKCFRYEITWSFLDVQRRALAKYSENIESLLGNNNPFSVIIKGIIGYIRQLLDIKKREDTNRNFEKVVAELLKKNAAIRHFEVKKQIPPKITFFNENNYPENWEEALKFLTPSVRIRWR